MSHKNYPYVFVLALMCLVMSGAGCETATPWPDFSGFIGDYKGMYRSETIEGMFVINHPDKNISDYSSFLVDPVSVYLSPNSEAYTMDKAEIAQLARYFRNSIIDVLDDNFAVVEKPGKGVLRVLVAITDIKPKGKTKIKGATIEAVFIDSESTVRVAAVLQSRKGDREKVFRGWAELLRDRLEELNKERVVYSFK